MLSRPTIEDRKALVKSATKLAEDTKVKIRASGTSATKAMNKLGFDKQTHEMKEASTRLDYITQIVLTRSTIDHCSHSEVRSGSGRHSETTRKGPCHMTYAILGTPRRHMMADQYP